MNNREKGERYSSQTASLTAACRATLAGFNIGTLSLGRQKRLCVRSKGCKLDQATKWFTYGSIFELVDCGAGSNLPFWTC
jgi:hypothetical protein